MTVANFYVTALQGQLEHFWYQLTFYIVDAIGREKKNF